MSDSSTRVTDDHFEYIAARTTADDEFLLSLKEAALAEGIPAIWVAPEQASFMQILLQLSRAKEVVEVGTLAGYAAIAMARALPKGGRVRTIEVSKKHAEFARTWAAKSDVKDRVEVHEGDARAVLATFADSSADAAFLDADKASYPVYLKHSLRIVRSGGLVMVDNAFAFGQLLDAHPTDSDVPAVREFNDLMAATRELHSVIVPIGDGLWVGVKR
jgi:predicted O-methyltransferase YrrM